MSVEEIVENAEGRTEGKMIVFISGKGGVGKTVTSVNMAVSLANKGFSTCILDGNFQFGDVNLALDIQASFTIIDIVKETEPLVNVKISYYLDKHNSGLNVLSAPMKPEQGDLITQFHIRAICNKILEQHDFLIVDLPTGLSENNLTFMEIAQKIFLVTDSSLAAVKNTKTMLRTIFMLNMNNKIKVIINHAEESNIINTKNIQDVLEVKKVAFISSNPKLVSKSFASGIPFVLSKPNEKISKEISALASELYNKGKSK
jgi:pilus assembly protein CpaE